VLCEPVFDSRCDAALRARRSAAQQAKDGGCLSPTARGNAGRPAVPQGEVHLQARARAARAHAAALGRGRMPGSCACDVHADGLGSQTLCLAVPQPRGVLAGTLLIQSGCAGTA